MIHLAYIWILSHELELEIVELPVFSSADEISLEEDSSSEMIHQTLPVKQNCPFIFLVLETNKKSHHGLIDINEKTLLFPLIQCFH